ncbi:hypothetical protein [Halomonas sp. JS92-SW72]|uniref:hypothetical protein n=1 Tax=Halomonas sp. JS92-SW72 TaxID=2306583 RepID=UPI0013C30295|nr:hypothetical protein [Halomonas sp. JS92-SW72]
MSNKPTLTQSELDILSLASSQAVTNAFSSLKGCFQRGVLLSDENPYSCSASDKLKTDWKDLEDQFRDDSLLEYLSASVLLHAYDGWSYLAQSMQSMIRGDLGAVRHLAYYAELRASISILASQGVGIYGCNNVVVDSAGCVYKFSKKSTHTIAWLSLEEWSKSSSSGELFGEEIAAFSRPLHEWLHGFEKTPLLNYTGASLINAWGCDLEKYSGDRGSRNEVSYQVNIKNPESGISPKNFYDFIKEIWEASDPSMLAFSSLDMHLLKSVLLRIYNDKGVIFGGKSYNDVVSQVCDDLGVGEYAKNFLKQRDGDPDLSILGHARNDRSTFDDYQFLDMFSRAFLLLRISSACISKMLKESGMSMDDFDFWWGEVAYSSGLVEEGMLVGDCEADIESLWIEIEDAITGLGEHLEEEVTCWKKFMRDGHLFVEPLSRLEKIAFFGMSGA